MAHYRDEFGLTAKQRIFCREYAKTGNGRGSAIKAGIAKSCAAGWACKLMKREGAQRCVNHLRECMERDVIIDRQVQINKLENLYQEALAAGKFSAAKGALQEQDKILGLHYKPPDPIKTKAEQVHENEVVDMDKLPLDQIKMLAAPDEDADADADGG